MQTEATSTCEMLVGLRDVTVLGVDKRLRQPDQVCVELRNLDPSRYRDPRRFRCPRSTPSSNWGSPRDAVTRGSRKPRTLTPNTGRLVPRPIQIEAPRAARDPAESVRHDERAQTVILCAFARVRIDHPRSAAETGR